MRYQRNNEPKVYNTHRLFEKPIPFIPMPPPSAPAPSRIKRRRSTISSFVSNRSIELTSNRNSGNLSGLVSNPIRKNSNLLSESELSSSVAIAANTVQPRTDLPSTSTSNSSDNNNFASCNASVVNSSTDIEMQEAVVETSPFYSDEMSKNVNSTNIINPNQFDWDQMDWDMSPSSELNLESDEFFDCFDEPQNEVVDTDQRNQCLALVPYDPLRAIGNVGAGSQITTNASQNADNEKNVQERVQTAKEPVVKQEAVPFFSAARDNIRQVNSMCDTVPHTVCKYDDDIVMIYSRFPQPIPSPYGPLIKRENDSVVGNIPFYESESVSTISLCKKYNSAIIIFSRCFFNLFFFFISGRSHL